MKKMKLVLAALVVAGSLSANIGPPTVTDTVTGSAGAWTVDFTVNNNTNQGLYFFGVLGGTITGSPANWTSNADPNWSNASYGGSSTVYNTNWITDPSGSVAPGASLPGFDVLYGTVGAPSAVQWFAFTDYAYGGGSAYTAGGNFSDINNPGFEGITAGTATPEPSVFFPLSLGLIGLGVLIQRRRVA